MTRILVVGEDGLCSALGVRLVRECMAGWTLAQEPIDCKGGSRLIPALPRYLEQAEHVQPVLCIADSDGQCAVQLLGQWLPNAAPSDLLVRLAVTEAESWLLADRDGFAARFAVPANKLPQRPDEEPDPKSIVLRLASRSGVRRIREEVVSSFDRNRQGSGYNHHLRAFVEQSWNMRQAAERSPSLGRAVNNRGKVSVNLLNPGDVSIVQIAPGDRRIVRIKVPRADRRQRPVYIGVDPFRGTFRRNHEGDYRCTESEVRRMFSDQSDEPADSRILKGFALDDIHVESLRQFRTVFGSRTQHVWQGEDDRGLLEKLGGWRRDRVSGLEGLTVAGLLMFGREQAIRDPAATPGFHLDYRERFSDDPAIRWTDRLTLDGTWEGNLFQFYQRVMLKLSSGPGIKRPFQTNADGYRVAGTPVVEALQEALVNAIIHADYGGQGGIVIDRWVDRLEFTNPGTLLLSREQLLRGGVSECRNKSLQLMFQMLGAGDKAGSGIDKIRAGWASEHWSSPSLRETHRPDRVVLSLPMVSTLPENALDELQRRFGDRFAALNTDEVQAMVTAAVEGEVTNQRLQEMLTLHRVDITRMLRGLVRGSLLDSDGVGRGTRYRLPGATRTASEVTGAALGREAAPPISEAAPPISEAAPRGISTHRPSAEPPGEEAEPPDGELAALAARVRNARRVPPHILRDVLLDLCVDRFLTIQQLADLVGRDLEKLRDRHVRPLVDAGLLSLRFPQTPRHPEQAYRSTGARRSEAPEV